MQTAAAVARTTPFGAWDFSWGEVKQRVQDITEIQEKAATLSADIKTEGLSNSEKSGVCVGLGPLLAAPPAKKLKETLIKIAQAKIKEADNDMSDE